MWLCTFVWFGHGQKCLLRFVMGLYTYHQDLGYPLRGLHKKKIWNGVAEQKSLLSLAHFWQ